MMYYLFILIISILKSISFAPLLYSVYQTQMTINIPMETLLIELVITGFLMYIAAYKMEYLFFVLFLIRFCTISAIIAIKVISEGRFVFMYS
jgi:hypothetical protein